MRRGVIPARHHVDSEAIFPLPREPSLRFVEGDRYLPLMAKLKMTVTAALAGLLWGGCGQGSDRPANSNKIRVGYVGITCEAPIFTAVEKGFFKEEGLEVEMVKCDWKNYKDVLALGGYDITHHLIMYFLKPLEQGL